MGFESIPTTTIHSPAPEDSNTLHLFIKWMMTLFLVSFLFFSHHRFLHFINFLQLYHNSKSKCKAITIYQVGKREMFIMERKWATAAGGYEWTRVQDEIRPRRKYGQSK